jgi:hypothetical protein
MGPNLAALSAGPTGCSPERIVTSHEEYGFENRSWRAECDGRSFICSSVGQGDLIRQVTCSPRATYSRPSAPPRAAAPPRTSAPEPPGLSPVVRSVAADGTSVFKVRFKAGQFRLEATAKPSTDREHVVILVEVPAALRGTGCEFRIMLDGELVPGFAPAVVPGGDRGDRLAIRVPVAVFGRFAPGHRVVGRYCTDEWFLGPRTQERLQEFATRLREELRWLEARQPAAPR